MRHDMNGKCGMLRMFGIPNILEIVEAINNAELRILGVIGTYDMPVNACGFMKYIEICDMDIYDDYGKWEKDLVPYKN